MDPDGIIMKLTELKEELTLDNALFIPMNSEPALTLKEFIASKEDEAFILGNERYELDGETSVFINGEEHRISCFFNYNLQPDVNVPIYIYGPATSPSLTSLKMGFDEHELLGRLKDPSCEHILADIKHIIKELRNGNLPISERSKRAQRFYKCTRANMEHHLLWKSTEEVDTSLALIEDYVMRKCKSFLYAPEEDKRNNKIFLEKISTPIEANYSEFAEIFQKMTESNNPRSIGQLIVDLNIKLSGPETTAEELLEKLSEATMNAKPKMLILDLLYLQRFREHRWLCHGQVAYCLTNMIAVINHLVRPEEFGDENCLITPVMSDHTTTHYQGMSESTSNLPSAAPSSSFSDMASSVLNSIVFVPKAVGAAVVDTFSSGKRSLINDPIYTPLQKSILESTSVEQLTLGQVKAMYEDYKRILSLLNNNK